jgi:AraC-like DNA-binding protein
MPFSLNIYALIPLLTLLQGFIFSTLLLLRGRREERYSDYWLALSLLLLSINSIPYMLGWMDIGILWEQYTYLPWDGFWLAIPPTLFFFLKSLTNDQWRFSFRRESWHYWAYGLYFVEHTIAGSIGLFSRPSIQWWWDLSAIEIIWTIISWSIEIYYFILSYRLYQNYRTWTFNEFSDTEKVSFTWFRNFLIVKFSLTGIGILNNIYVQLAPEQGNALYALMWWGYLADTILIYYLSISGYTQTRVKTGRFIERPAKLPLDMAHKPIILTQNFNDIKNKNLLPDEEISAWKNKVLKFFDTEKPYLNPELTLSDLSDTLKTNTSVLSQVINSGFNKNFNDFVNEYRVEAFKQKIQSGDYQHLTLLAIAFECGFNSKTTFNRAFKKATGLMPSEYINTEFNKSS